MNYPERIHALNVAAGWWTDMFTGRSIILTRNRPEMLMLAVSELAEASDVNDIDNDCDTKMPEYLAFDVEIIDCFIRLYDQLGAEESLDGAPAPAPTELQMVQIHELFSATHVTEPRAFLMIVVSCLAASMEGFRKGNRSVYLQQMMLAIYALEQICELASIDVDDVIEAKLAFNAQREDHKLESRQGAGGKKF
jgi:hypothetical protein